VKATTMAGVVQGSCKVLRLPSIYRSSRRAATTTCAASKVDPPNLANLCEKARLTLTPEEVTHLQMSLLSSISASHVCIFTSLSTCWRLCSSFLLFCHSNATGFVVHGIPYFFVLTKT
jgi:hypothetical protein